MAQADLTTHCATNHPYYITLHYLACNAVGGIGCFWSAVQKLADATLVQSQIGEPEKATLNAS